MNLQGILWQEVALSPRDHFEAPLMFESHLCHCVRDGESEQPLILTVVSKTQALMSESLQGSGP